MNMILDTVRDAFGLIKTYPVIILTGFIIGILSFLELILTFSIDPFYTDFLRIFQIFLLPFLIAGAYGVVKKKEGGVAPFLKEGSRYYFRVLIPTILIFFIVLVTTILVLIPLAAIGLADDMSTVLMVLIGVFLPIGMFTFFYDAAAVFEDKKTFDSILRSVSVVLGRFFPCLLFYILLLGLVILIFLGATMVLSILLAGQFEPLLQMTPAELEMLTPSDILALLGDEGALVLSAVYIAGLSIFATFLYPLKAAFFLHITSGLKEQDSPTQDSPTQDSPTQDSPPLEGEYDEKGRYYKY